MSEKKDADAADSSGDRLGGLKRALRRVTFAAEAATDGPTASWPQA
jgi:hypothetical protein